MLRRAVGSLVVCLAVLGAPAPRAAPVAFLAGTEDVPLAPGLVSEAGSLVVFDKPEGRIVEIEAMGALTRRAVESFYAASLPELGWAAAGPLRWNRDGEALSLAIGGRDGDIRVGFTLSPR